MAVLNFRRRPRKSKYPQRSKFDSAQDEEILCPVIEKTVPFKKSIVNKGKKEVLLARTTGISSQNHNNLRRTRKGSADDLSGFRTLTEKTGKNWENRGKRMVQLARDTKISLPILDDHQLLDQEPFLNEKSAATQESTGQSKTKITFKKKLVVMIDIPDRVTKQKTGDICSLPSEQNQREQLPLELKKYVKELGATGEPVLVIEKKLSSSDVNTGLQRLSIPVKQVLNHGFLTEEERRRFNIDNKQQEINALLIEPSLAQSGIKFKKWYMGNSEVYVLVSGWNEVVKRNGLKPETQVQLWSFKKDSQLYFVLVRL